MRELQILVSKLLYRYRRLKEHHTELQTFAFTLVPPPDDSTLSPSSALLSPTTAAAGNEARKALEELLQRQQLQRAQALGTAPPGAGRGDAESEGAAVGSASQWTKLRYCFLFPETLLWGLSI
jgi:hypothetical protein